MAKKGAGKEQTWRPNRGGVGAPKERLFVLRKQNYKDHTKLSQKVNKLSVASLFFKPVSMKPGVSAL